VERGLRVNVLEDARHSSVLYICKYFVGKGKYGAEVKGMASVIKAD
jgi:hypothetical protein